MREPIRKRPINMYCFSTNQWKNQILVSWHAIQLDNVSCPLSPRRLCRGEGAWSQVSGHEESHTCRTHAFIFVFMSAAHGSRAPTYLRWRRRWSRTIWRPYLSTYVLLTSLQFDIRDPFHGQLTAVKSRCPLTSITWPYRGLRLELIEVKCFLKLTAD